MSSVAQSAGEAQGEPDIQPVPPALGVWMDSHVAGFSGGRTLQKFGFGQSNPTYRLRAESGQYVLRRKPLGPLLPKAHAIEREYRVLDALRDSNVPVPKVLAFCEDNAILGAPFYIMDFVERQVATWTRQYRASEGDPCDAMERLIEWLPANLPPEQPARIFHGDLRLDNMIFHPTEPRVIALLDWELSTIGDPLADFAYHTMVWRVGADLFRGFGDLDRAAMGIPEEADYVRLYCERTGRTGIPPWNFYLAFSLFRVAAILQGVWRRSQDGQASSADAEIVGANAHPLAEIGWQIACEG